ncbi:serine/threonine-protein kinase [Archangium sp.]|uniref:serine/threonine-protein kinase n=1 Tax=Archangium sp. TaxID=1872627 RepID=UPI002D56D6BB|nr:serine/threonine-protein kinase [Archangium sp.]HYO52663.1 serine/threonine-protein kinase [Archangium sp.]
MGTYRIIRRLASSAVAEVFLARTVGAGGLESPVVIERLLPGVARDATFVDLFLGSARTSAALPHANVVRVLDAGLSGDQPCRVLEFVDGEGLCSLLAARARGLVIGLREVCFIVLQVAEGLACLHQVRASHRGLHPSHVWISSGGEVKLVDTGGASRSDPPYLTPEQARGRPADPRGDVFRLGLLLYELLAGRPLFEGSHPQAIHHIGAFDERGLEPLPGCPPSLWSVLLHAIAADPEARVHSARALADTLREFLLERELVVDHRDIASLFARVFPSRRPPLEEEVSAPGQELSLTGRTPPRPAALPHIVRTEPGWRVHAEPPPVLYPVEPPPPPNTDVALEERPAEGLETPTPPCQTGSQDLHARLFDKALELIGGGAELAPLLVRLTRRCVAHLGGGDSEETLAVMGARTLVLAARLEEPRRFVLPTLGRVRTLVDGFPELDELFSAVLLAGRDSGPPAGCVARALLCAAAFVVQVQCASPGVAESARVLDRLRRDPRLVSAALEALAAELGVETRPPHREPSKMSAGAPRP